MGVDPLSRVELWDIILQMIRDEHLTVIVATAYLDEAERCGQVFVMHEGRLLTSGAPEDIGARASGLCFIATPPGGQPPRAMQSRLLDDTENIIDAVPQGGALRFIRHPEADQQRLDALLGGVRRQPRRAPSRRRVHAAAAHPARSGAGAGRARWSFADRRDPKSAQCTTAMK